MALIVNGERVEDSMIQREVERLRPDYEKTFRDQPEQQRNAQLLEWSKENVIEMTLLRQEASKRYTDKIPEDKVEQSLARIKKDCKDEQEFRPEFGVSSNEKAKELIRTALQYDLLLEQIYSGVPTPSKEDVAGCYEQNKELFERPEQVHVAHIVKHIDWRTDEQAAYQSMLEVQAELNNGAVFEMLAEKYSDCPDDRGDLGYITRREMVEEFDDAVFNLDVGQVSNIFRTRFGYHMAKVYDRKPGVVPPLKEVASEVKSELQRYLREKAFEDFVDRLKCQAQITELP